MANILLRYSSHILEENISFNLPPSKSLEARRMILRAIRRMPIAEFDTGEQPDDLKALQQALLDFIDGSNEINVFESGTAMRFMLAYLACQTRTDIVLRGEGRQHDRPIAPLVDALRELGSKIEYLGREGYPPLLVKHSELESRKIYLDASDSSQYLSALLLIAPLLTGKNYQIDTTMSSIASRPYAIMTIEEMREAGFIWQQKEGLFSYLNTSVPKVSCPLQYEADWSAASYAYLLMDLLGNDFSAYTVDLCLHSLFKDSKQGDEAFLRTVYERLGVRTIFHSKGCSLTKAEVLINERLVLDCRNNPDVVPAIVATCIGQRRSFTLRGVKHLRLKESDRLDAIGAALAQLEMYLKVDEDSISWDSIDSSSVDQLLTLDPRRDHRIAMAFAPLMAKHSSEGVVIEGAECVSKSFPNYWKEIEKLGYITTTI